MSNLFDVSGKVACVTGASSGLGRRAATALARAGASVVGVARRSADLEDWRREAGGQTAAVTADIAYRERVASLAANIAGRVWTASDPGACCRHQHTRNGRRGDARRLGHYPVAQPDGSVFPLKSLRAGDAEKRWGRIVTFASCRQRARSRAALPMARRRAALVSSRGRWPRHGRRTASTRTRSDRGSSRRN